MKNTVLKGLIMGLVGLVASMFSELETLNVAYIALSVIGFTGTYLLKNWLYPSMSKSMTVQTRDFVNGLVVAVLMGISTYAANLLTDVAFSWPDLLKAVAVAFLGYFVKTVPSNKGNIAKSKK